MKRIGLFLLFIFLVMGSLTAEEMFFPNEDFILRLPLEGDWAPVQSETVANYTVFSTHKGDIELVLYFTGDVIAPIEHLEKFLAGEAPFSANGEVERTNEDFAFYTKQVYDLYLAEMYNYYAVSGSRSADGEKIYFFTRAFFPDYYGVIVMASVPLDKKELYKHELKSLLDF